jgi:hypothetical protein
MTTSHHFKNLSLLRFNFRIKFFFYLSIAQKFLLVTEKNLNHQNQNFSTFYKKNSAYKKNKKFVTIKKKFIPVQKITNFKWIFVKPRPKSLLKKFFTSNKIILKRQLTKKYFSKKLNFFLIKQFFKTFKNPKILWWNLLITIAELKMRAMLEHYDYFGLYTTARNYTVMHSQLHLNKSLVHMFLNWKQKKKKINVFFKKLFIKFLYKKKKKLRWKFWYFKFLSPFFLRRWMFKRFYAPFSINNFEKTDPLQWSLFLDKYLIFRKLLPNSTPDFFGHISKITKTEKFLYAYPYHVSAAFFKHFFSVLWKKKKRFLGLKKIRNKIFIKKFLFSYINMIMLKLPTNIFTKRTAAYFSFPFKFIKYFLAKIFETKKNWLTIGLNKRFGFLKNSLIKNKNFWKSIWDIRLAYSLNWSSAKRFFWKTTEHNNYVNLDYFKTAKYVWYDLVVTSFNKFIWKDFLSYIEKFNYNTLNFNYKRLLRTLLPHKKLIEYSLLKSNNLNTSVLSKNLNRKFFSLLKIFWGGQEKKHLPLSSYKLTYPIDFDLANYEFNTNLIDFLHDVDVSQIFFSHPYENYFFYYKENFYENKKTAGFEFLFSKNLVLAATTLW